VLLSVSLASPPPIDHPQFRTDARALADAAFAAVKGTDRRVLLDFSAVWCPPCNQLAAEVLHAATPPTILDQFEVVVLDVDDPRSWALKDRYQVGGYPTVVIADAEGQEVGREVGFPGRERFVLWLEEMAQRTEKAPDYTHVDPATLTPEQAGEVAWQLVKRGQGAGAWIARAEEAEPTTALRLARVRSAPNIKDVSWLADHAPERTLDWISGVASLREDPAGRDVMRRAIALALPGVRGAEAADLLYYSAQLASEEEAPVLYAAAASLLRESFTGEPFRDRAHVTFLASLLAKSGDLPAAVDALRDATARWPGEPTFLLTEARLQLEAGDSRAALAAGEACMGSAWGDNRLRCAALVCEALTGLDRGDEARSRAEAVLTEIAPPDPSLDVRAPRYRRALQAYIDAP